MKEKAKEKEKETERHDLNHASPYMLEFGLSPYMCRFDGMGIDPRTSKVTTLDRKNVGLITALVTLGSQMVRVLCIFLCL
jgi:hypothetical protein